MNKILVLLLLFAFACQPAADESSAEAEPANDPHSFARPQEAVTEHLSLSLRVDFEQWRLSGYACYRIRNQGADSIVLDTRNLAIERVTLGTKEEPATFRLGLEDELLGQPLIIDISPETEQLTIYYSTTEGADALDWLAPGQTAGKRNPFLFTQGQAILTRTWIPCQDSPGIRITYDAQIEVPEGLLAVMSAENPQEKSPDGRYRFTMEQPIPPYLLALAVGDLAFRSVGPRTGLYAEPPLLEAAAYEFAEMEDMLEATEALYGPYRWERYDLIVLPPSFPFGGMENPRLTFATPSIIAGDRSLTALVAHELAHSWSGNLVTNAAWDDFWLNEGFTVYIERRIMEALYGTDYVDMLAVLGYQDLQADLDDLGPRSPDTRLKLELAGRDPDEGMTDIAYEKGGFFLQMLEEKAGRDTFDAFLKQYFDEHAFRTVTTEEFVAYLNEHLLEPQKLDVDVDAWIYQPGIPESMPAIRSPRLAAVDSLRRAFLEKGTLPDAQAWSTHEWLHFIRGLPTPAPREKLAALDAAFELTASGNAEIQAAWFDQAIRSEYVEPILPALEEFLVRVGRRKFLTPLYRALAETGQVKTARAIYTKARPGYHAVSRNTMDALLLPDG